MKVALIGASGQLGTDLHKVLQCQGVEVPPIEPRVDVRDAQGLMDLVSAVRPDVVINTAAFHQVEQCEKQPEAAFQVNAIGVHNLAAACAQHGAKLVHFSTDYVFDGTKGKPYSEADPPAPLNAYGVSKVAGEHMVAYATRQHFLVRICGLYGLAGSHGKGSNFVETMLKKAADGAAIRVVNDQVLTPTYTLDLAEKVSRLITTEAYGLYHLSCEGQCSWYEFACQIFELSGIKANVTACSTADFPSPVKRPAFSVLSKAKFNSLGLGEMPQWQDALARYLQARAEKQNEAITTAR